MNSVNHLPINHSSLDHLVNNPALQPNDPSQAKKDLEAYNAGLESAAKEFESVFLSMMLKEMRNTLDQQEGGLFGKEGSDTFGGMFDMFMGQHLADAQPLGIANAIKTYTQSAESS